MRAKKKLLLLGLVAPASLLVLELAFRGWVASRGLSAARMGEQIRVLAGELDRSSDAFGGSTGAADSDATDETFAHPYFGWYSGAAEARIPNLARAATDAYEILVVGGSVAGQVVSVGGESLLEAVRADPRLAGREVRLVAQARGGFKQPQQLNLVSYLLGSGWRPDAIVNVDGFNEVALGYQNARDFEVHPNHPAFFLWGPVATADSLDREALDRLLDLRLQQRRGRALAERVARFRLDRSAVLAHVCLGRMRGIRGRFYAARDAHLEWVSARELEHASAGPPFDAGLDAVLELAVRNWSECSLSLQALCDRRAIYYLHVLQPTLHDRGSKPLTARERSEARAPESWVEGAREGYPRLRAAGAELRRAGVNFVDGSGFFADVEERRYSDACHFVPSGCSELGRWIGTAFADNRPPR